MIVEQGGGKIPVMASVLFILHKRNEAAKGLAERGKGWLAERGMEPLVLEAVPEATGLQEVPDLIVGLGGDGTMLRAMELAASLAVPVMGVNLGRLGYLTEIEPGGLEDALERFLSGRCTIEDRMTLSYRLVLPGEDTSRSGLALNEVVLEKTLPGHTVTISASIEGRRLLTYEADGLVVCTPTGSTAYNLSLRGPILSPTVQAMVLSPISPHMLFDRSLVLRPEEGVVLRMEGERAAVCVVDGVEIGFVHPGGEVHCEASDAPVKLVKLDGTDLRSVLKGKFGLADR